MCDGYTVDLVKRGGVEEERRRGGEKGRRGEVV